MQTIQENIEALYNIDELLAKKHEEIFNLKAEVKELEVQKNKLMKDNYKLSGVGKKYPQTNQISLLTDI